MKSPRCSRRTRSSGFTLLPVVLAMSLIAAIAFLLNRDNGFNANLVGANSDRERARYAAEAGLQAANYAIQARACAGGYPTASSPVTASNFGAVNDLGYSAYASAAAGSPLTLTSTGSYNGASVTLSKPTVYAFQSGIWTWTVQPAPSASKDTAVVSSSPASNYGSDNEFTLDTGRELLIQFDIAPLPAGSRIVPWYGAGPLQPGAKLMLYRNNTASATESIYVMLITRGWSESRATWNYNSFPTTWPSPGVGYDPRPLSINPYLTVAFWQSLDLTNAAIAWRNGLYPNNGVWIRGGPLVHNAKFALSSEGNVAHRPKLVVSYLLPCGATAPS